VGWRQWGIINLRASGLTVDGSRSTGLSHGGRFAGQKAGKTTSGARLFEDERSSTAGTLAFLVAPEVGYRGMLMVGRVEM
jgi:hypothetical protein